MTLFFREYDVDGDGVFDYEEFARMMHAALDGYGILDDDPGLADGSVQPQATLVIPRDWQRVYKVDFC